MWSTCRIGSANTLGCRFLVLNLASAQKSSLVSLVVTYERKEGGLVHLDETLVPTLTHSTKLPTLKTRDYGHTLLCNLWNYVSSNGFWISGCSRLQDGIPTSA
nr:RcOsp8 [Ceratobasidium cereale]